MSCRKFRWPSMKVLQIKYADLSCSDVHWNFWRMCNALRLRSEGCNWYRLAISLIWRRRNTIKCLKKSAVFILHFAPSLRFTLSLHFTPGPQSAVCGPQSAFFLKWRTLYIFFPSPPQINIMLLLFHLQYKNPFEVKICNNVSFSLL